MPNIGPLVQPFVPADAFGAAEHRRWAYSAWSHGNNVRNPIAEELGDQYYNQMDDFRLAPMNPTLILIYGTLVFLATVVASIPFGFVQGFTEARGQPLSQKSLSLLKYPERAMELLAVILVLAHLSARQLNEPLLHAASAIAFGALITFLVEVRTRLMSGREFALRVLAGLVVCAPLGMYVGSSIHT